MAKLNEKQKILAFVGGGVLLCGIAGGGVYWANGLVEQKQQEIDAAQEQIAATRAKIAKIPGLEKDVIILRENVDHYEQILPDQSEVTNFIRTVNQYALKSGVQVKRFNKSAEGTRGGYSHYQYQLSCTGDLWQFLEFMNAFENHPRFISVVDFTVKPAAPDEVLQAQLRGEDPIHEYTLGLETYVYEHTGDANNTPISRYEQRRKELREQIKMQRTMLALESYQLSDAVGRRDIFLDPRPRVGGTGIAGNPRAMQEKIVGDFVKRVAELSALHKRWEEERNYLLQQRLERQLRDGLAALDERAAVETPKLTDSALFARWTQEVLTPVREMRRDVEGREQDTSNRISVEQIEALLSDMRDSVERGDFETAISRHDEMRDQLRFAADDPRTEPALRAEKLRYAVEAALDFSEIKMEIQGVVVFESGRRGVLLNGRVYEEGEYVQDDLLLKSVQQEEAEFVFRGFRLAKKW